MKLEDLLAGLRSGKEKEEGKGHWVFRRRSFRIPVGLILVITADDGFEQHFYLKVIPGSRGYKMVDSVGHPYRTPAMRAALRHVLDRPGRI